jgi:GntR family transcriptional regulator
VPRSTRRAARGVKYPIVAEWLREQISSGEFPAGTQLPAQRELAAHVGVTVMTFRRAVEDLEADGWLTTRHGVGTFVAMKPGARVPKLRSFDEIMCSQGRATQTRVLAHGPASASADVADALGLAPGAQVWQIERLRVVDDVPFTWQHSSQAVLPLDRQTVGRLTTQSLYALLAERGFVVDTGRQDVRATALPGEIAGHLDVPEGSPCLEVERVTADRAGRPILHDQIYTRGDLALLHTDAAASALDVRVDDARLERRSTSQSTGR